jgi:hypothetical protein
LNPAPYGARLAFDRFRRAEPLAALTRACPLTANPAAYGARLFAGKQALRRWRANPAGKEFVVGMHRQCNKMQQNCNCRLREPVRRPAPPYSRRTLCSHPVAYACRVQRIGGRGPEFFGHFSTFAFRICVETNRPGRSEFPKCVSRAIKRF